MSELLDIVDQNGNPTGETVDREYAHSNGVWHRTAHVWLVREKDGALQILLQKRAETKKSYPGCYDISSAGHIPAGIDYKTSAIRELKEELGIDAEESELLFCADRIIAADAVFSGKPFLDRQYSRVFILRRDLPEREIVVQPEEVDSVCWMDFKECCHGVANNLFRHCIAEEELEILKRTLEC